MGQLLTVARECSPCAFAEVFGFLFQRKDLDVYPLSCYRFVFLSVDVVLERIFRGAVAVRVPL